MKKAVVATLIVLTGLIICSGAFADNPLDTPSGYLITALGTSCAMNYTDAVLTQKATVFATSSLATVSPEYGFTGLASLGAATTKPGVAKNWDYVITNEGNAADNYGLKYTTSFTNCTGTDWKVELINITGAPTTISTRTAAGTSQVTTGSVGEDSVFNLRVLVTPSTQDSYAPNGSFCVVTLDVTTGAKPVGKYQGANTYWYGGTSEALDTTITSIETSFLIFTRQM